MHVYCTVTALREAGYPNAPSQKCWEANGRFAPQILAVRIGYLSPQNTFCKQVLRATELPGLNSSCNWVLCGTGLSKVDLTVRRTLNCHEGSCWYCTV